jgi:hypothetical protein
MAASRHARGPRLGPTGVVGQALFVPWSALCGAHLGCLPGALRGSAPGSSFPRSGRFAVGAICFTLLASNRSGWVDGGSVGLGPTLASPRLSSFRGSARWVAPAPLVSRCRRSTSRDRTGIAASSSLPGPAEMAASRHARGRRLGPTGVVGQALFVPWSALCGAHLGCLPGALRGSAPGSSFPRSGRFAVGAICFTLLASNRSGWVDGGSVGLGPIGGPAQIRGPPRARICDPCGPVRRLGSPRARA